MKMRYLLGAGVIALAALVVVTLRKSEADGEVRRPVPSRTSIKSPGRTEPVASAPAASLPSGVTIPARNQVEGQPALFAPQPGDLATTETAPLADRIGSPNTPPEQEAKVVLDLLKLYRRLFGAYPAGENNQQFVNALLGANKQKLPLLARDHPRLNTKGELVDAWGTPFFFHQNSRNSVEVRSAGPDHLMYTDDDIVAGKPPAHSERSVATENAP